MMKSLGIVLILVIVAVIAFGGGYVFSRSMKIDLPYAAPTFNTDGSVSVPAFELPPSELMSEEAKNLLKLRALAPPYDRSKFANIEEFRSGLDTRLSPMVATARNLYPVNQLEQEIAGVPVRIFTPEGQDARADKVLINLHGGAFSVCWDSCSILESIPIASIGGYKVISVNYRMAPEYQHPAAIDDVVAVYTELLEKYAPESVGIYGCSAGGALTAQSIATFAAAGIPQPGAVGIFGMGALGPQVDGDASYLSAYIEGAFPPPQESAEETFDVTFGYLDGADISGPIISPAAHQEVLKDFPPSMLITGTRAFDLSHAVYTNSQLIKAGVETKLIVGEAMGHCYTIATHLPESVDAFDATVQFFDQHLN